MCLSKFFPDSLRSYRCVFAFFMAVMISACGGSSSDSKSSLQSTALGESGLSSILLAASKVPPGKSKPGSATLSPNIAAWGDSLTAGASGNPYPTQLTSLLPGRTIFNGGVAGNTSTSIAARQGSIPFTITLEANVIPSTGPVNVVSTSIPVVDSWNREPVYGGISGIAGRIERIPDPDRTKNVLQFYRDTTGTVVAIANSTPFIVSTFGREQWINILWMGTNNYWLPDTVISDINSAVAFLPSPKRFAVISVLNNSDLIKGTWGYQTILDLNSRISALYPSNYIDIRGYLLTQYDPASPQDVLDVQNGVTPSSLRLDNIHLNSKGDGLVAAKVRDFIQSKGW